MSHLRIVACGVFAVTSILTAAPCTNAPLSTYLNGGSFFSCTESAGNLALAFNHDLPPSYIGLNLLAANNSAANPNNINVTLGSPGLFFNSNTFTETGPVLASQAELVHFLISANVGSITSTTFSLSGVSVGNGGGLGLGTGLAIGQEIVCIGGTFTSLPTGLVTTVANGVIPGNPFGCNGVAMVGTAATSIGPLSALTGLGLPNLAGVTNQASIIFTPSNQGSIDVIKIQALVTALGGTASTTGFGDDFGTATPEPASVLLSFVGLAAIAIGRRRIAK